MCGALGWKGQRNPSPRAQRVQDTLAQPYRELTSFYFFYPLSIHPSPLPPFNPSPKCKKTRCIPPFRLHDGAGCYFFPLSFGLHGAHALTHTHAQKESPVLLCWAEIQNKLQAGGEWSERMKYPSSVLNVPEIQYRKASSKKMLLSPK